jgi:hypothetical protein
MNWDERAVKMRQDKAEHYSAAERRSRSETADIIGRCLRQVFVAQHDDELTAGLRGRLERY